MPRETSGDSGYIWKIVDRLTMLGLKIGGLVFIVLCGWLLWGIYSGGLAMAGTLKGKDLAQAIQNVQTVCNILLVSGCVVFVSAAYQFFQEEVTGYVLIMAGALMRWGVPALAAASERGSTAAEKTIPSFVVSQFLVLGAIALAVAVPLVLRDLWERMRGTRKWISDSTVQAAKRELTSSGIHMFCWQTAHCRENLLGVCQAYQRKRNCWLIKTGCMCDEERMLRLVVRGPVTPGQTVAKTAPMKILSAAEKRQRCRECCIFRDHQELKYKLISPLVFPAVFAFMYFGYQPIKSHLHDLLALTDRFSKYVTFTPNTTGTTGTPWMNTPAASSSVEWVFIILLGLVMATYLLRLLEYLVYDLQI